ncbi:MAG: GNAT family N-acetyltransferase [Lysobacteraceae bacterium]|jgi:putative acetyltransferase|nr:MAG: GNAT family N-acetyltransferase [Xanthomonadaceae bacterium]
MTHAREVPAAGQAVGGDLRIVRDALEGGAVIELLHEHLRDCHALSPPGSVHALDLVALRAPDITFWSAWDELGLLGCGALRELDPAHGEVKSMRTATAHLRKGVAAAMLAHIIGEAGRRGYRRLSLETGSMAAFEPARRLYARHGFVECAPFPPYRDDPHSTFMTLELGVPKAPSAGD